MKSKMLIIIFTLFISVWTLSVNAQTAIPEGKVQLIEFTNATAKFTVPEGKRWTIHNAFASYPGDDNTYSIWIKSINGTILFDPSKMIAGKCIWSSNLLVNLNLPLVLPENTSFELVITKKADKTRSLYDTKAFLNYTEN